MTTRRKFIQTSLAIPAVVALDSVVSAKEPVENSTFSGSRWPLCLDTATIRPVPLIDKIKIAAEAGFDAIEPWDGELRDYEKSGGDLEELGQRIKDAGLFVPSVIGLWNAIPATQEEWEANLPATRNRMRMASAIGSEFVQVIPQPARPRAQFDPHWAAMKYCELIEIGTKDYNLKPALVFVEFLEGCKTLGQAAQIALDCGHPEARIIPDVFHMHIGGSSFGSLKKLTGDSIAIFQFNDAPVQPKREQLQDSHRVFPGDGILPLEQSIRDLARIGFKGCISLELYNPEYWKRDPLEVAREGIEKTKAVIEKAMS